MKKATIAVLATMLGVVVSVSSANASGGPCGKKHGFIRGDIGKFCRQVVNPVVSPALQVGTEIGMVGVGAYYGGPGGAQLGKMGADWINGGGARPFGNPMTAAHPGQSVPQGAQQMHPQRAMMPVPPQALGAYCQTPFGTVGPGPINPVGAPCFVETPGRIIPGRVI